MIINEIPFWTVFLGFGLVIRQKKHKLVMGLFHNVLIYMSMPKPPGTLFHNYLTFYRLQV